MAGLILKDLNCPNCQHTQIEITINQFVAYNGLVWSVSHYCEICGHGIEEDGTGFIEEPWRSVIITENGTWYLRIKTQDLTAKVIKVLRENVDISVQQISQMRLDSMSILFQGTNFEVDFLGKKIEELGVKVSKVIKEI